MNRHDNERLRQLRSLQRQRRILGALWLLFGAFLVGMILAAPVMREPASYSTTTTAD